MPLDRKYGLVEIALEQKGPHSEYSIAFGPKADAQKVTIWSDDIWRQR